MCFILSWQDVPLSPAIICSNKGRKNNVRIIGTIWELKKNNRKLFSEVLERIFDGFSSTLGSGLVKSRLVQSLTRLKVIQLESSATLKVSK